MIMQAPTMGNENFDEEYFQIWLGPYIGTRAITTEQATQTIASGVSLETCHDRLLDAECLLMTTHDPKAWQRGWLDGVNAITWLATPENSDELGIADLLEIAEDRHQELRRECYATALTTGTPALDEITYSNTIGRVECCTAGMLFVVDEGNDWREIASVLKSTTDLKELKSKADKKREEDYLSSRNRIPALIEVLGSLQAIGGAK